MGNGRKFVGTFDKGRKNGKGEFTWGDGRKFVGKWKDGKLDGEGVMKMAGGEEKVGKWEDGKTVKLILNRKREES